MKIHNELTNHHFVLPLESDVNIIVDHENKDELLKCINQAVNAKRKSKDLKLETDDGQPFNLKLSFIYYPYVSTNIDANMNFKAKSEFTTQLSEFIFQNPEKFKSVEMIRNGMYDLKTDPGMLSFQRIITMGIPTYSSIELNDFKIESLIEMMKMDDDQLTTSEKFMMLYNLDIYIHRNNQKIVYIDFPIDDETVNWIGCQRNDDTIFLIDNESIVTHDLNNLIPCNIIKLSANDFKEEYEIESHEIQTVSYLFHDYILKNLSQQTEKNIRFLNMFLDKQTTFLLKFNDIIPSKVL